MAETKTDDSLETLKKDLANLKAELSTLGKDVKTLARNGAAPRLHALREEAQSAVESLREQGREAVQTVGTTVKSRPAESLLVAFGIGVLLGQIIRK